MANTHKAWRASFFYLEENGQSPSWNIRNIPEKVKIDGPYYLNHTEPHETWRAWHFETDTEERVREIISEGATQIMAGGRSANWHARAERNGLCIEFKQMYGQYHRLDAKKMASLQSAWKIASAEDEHGLLETHIIVPWAQTPENPNTQSLHFSVAVFGPKTELTKKSRMFNRAVKLAQENQRAAFGYCTMEHWVGEELMEIFLERRTGHQPLNTIRKTRL